jgi:hypothetical protein
MPSRWGGAGGNQIKESDRISFESKFLNGIRPGYSVKLCAWTDQQYLKKMKRI